MLIRTYRAARGFSLVELMIATAVLAMLIMIALPSMTTWIRNTKIRSANETIQAGLMLARAEALRRNTVVRFQFVDNMSSTCNATMGTTNEFNTVNWVVSLDDPTGRCDAEPSDTAAPRIIQKFAAPESLAFPWGINIFATPTTGSDTALVFNGLGRLANPIAAAGVSPSVARIDIEPNSTSAYGCVHQSSASSTRCLRLTVTNGGQVRSCDPAVTDNTDPRIC